MTMMFNSYNTSFQPSYINWAVGHDYLSRGLTQLSASNFQDIFNLTKRVGEIEVKMNKLKFRSQGIGGMVGIAAGALGGPLGSIIGFGVGRAVGSFVGNGLAKKYYGEEQSTINEHLFLARQRDTQIKYQIGQFGSLGQVIGTLRQNDIKDTQKIYQDMLVL